MMVFGSQFVRANKALIDRIRSVVYTQKGALSQFFRVSTRAHAQHSSTRARA